MVESAYDCEKIEVRRGETLLLVSLNKSYDQDKASQVYKRPNIYECTRKYWLLNKTRLDDIDYVLGVYRGVVREVIKPTRWFEADKADDGTVFKKTRYGCEGEELSDSPYMNKDVTDYPFGTGNSIRYVTSETVKRGVKVLNR